VLRQVLADRRAERWRQRISRTARPSSIAKPASQA